MTERARERERHYQEAAMAMVIASQRQFSTSSCSWAVPRSPPTKVLGLGGQVRLLKLKKQEFARGEELRVAAVPRVLRLRRSQGGPRAAFISPPADPQFMKLEDDGVLGSVPVAPRGPKPIITWSLVAGLLWKQKLRLTVAAAALVAATTCTLTMPLFSGLCITAFFQANGVSPYHHFDVAVGDRTVILIDVCIGIIISVVYRFLDVFTIKNCEVRAQ